MIRAFIASRVLWDVPISGSDSDLGTLPEAANFGDVNTVEHYKLTFPRRYLRRRVMLGDLYI